MPNASARSATDAGKGMWSAISSSEPPLCTHADERDDLIGRQGGRRRQHPFDTFAALHCVGDDEDVGVSQQCRRYRLICAGHAIAVCSQQRREGGKPSVDGVEVAVGGIDAYTRPRFRRELRRGDCRSPVIGRDLARGMSGTGAEH